jgi:hypothetical protein
VIGAALTQFDEWITPTHQTFEHIFDANEFSPLARPFLTLIHPSKFLCQINPYISFTYLHQKQNL